MTACIILPIKKIGKESRVLADQTIFDRAVYEYWFGAGGLIESTIQSYFAYAMSFK